MPLFNVEVQLSGEDAKGTGGAALSREEFYQ